MIPLNKVQSDKDLQFLEIGIQIKLLDKKNKFKSRFCFFNFTTNHIIIVNNLFRKMFISFGNLNKVKEGFNIEDARHYNWKNIEHLALIINYNNYKDNLSIIVDRILLSISSKPLSSTSNALRATRVISKSIVPVPFT